MRDALVVLRQAPDVDEGAGHLDVALDLRDGGVADRQQSCLAAQQRGADLIGDQLGAHAHRLQVVEACVVDEGSRASSPSGPTEVSARICADAGAPHSSRPGARRGRSANHM